MAIEAKITLEGVSLAWEEDGVIKTKTVSLPDFARTLLQQVGLTVGPLPLGPNARGIRYIKQAEALFIYMEDPPRPLPTRFGDTEYNIIAPRSLWEFKIAGASTQAGKLQDVRVYALAEPLTHTSVNCYTFPFCNTYAEGRVCWGQNRDIMIDRQFTELMEIPDIYWSSGFNGDLDHNITSAVAGVECRNTEAIFKQMQLTGQTLDPDFLGNPRPFAQILGRGDNI